MYRFDMAALLWFQLTISWIKSHAIDRFNIVALESQEVLNSSAVFLPAFTQLLGLLDIA
jgi:hypothetical protein